MWQRLTNDADDCKICTKLILPKLLQYYILSTTIKLTTVSEWWPSLKYSSMGEKTCTGSVGSQPA